MATKPKTAAIRTYEIVTHGDTFQLDVPETFRVTYAPTVMGQKGYGGSEMALRFYEAENKQRAIFVGVQSFRDLSLPLRKKVRRVEGKTEFKIGPDGSELHEQETIDEEWGEVN